MIVTPNDFIHAARNGQLNFLENEIEKGMPLGVKDSFGMTALHHAAKHGQGEAVDLLLERGADKSIRDNMERLPVELALGSERCSREIVKALLVEGLDSKDMEKLYSSAAMHSEETDCDMMKYLVELGFPLFTKRIDFNLKLFNNAISLGKVKTVKFLIEAGAHINPPKAVSDKSPLIWALYANEPKMVKLLLRTGADINRKDRMGQLPLYYALNSKSDVCAKELILAGASVSTPLYKGGSTFREALNKLRASANPGSWEETVEVMAALEEREIFGMEIVSADTGSRKKRKL